ncbi:hypothetical protein D7003_13405 [Arthrobacter oryzae]|uniref:Uncharacterized protein n=1 Tax=Arthrobacter oryzae TaxID=409290 RepID=A0A3N0BV33_9MICC|nr:hypothetical protein D7003_13405 [Arthrobacter oryzae]
MTLESIKNMVGDFVAHHVHFAATSGPLLSWRPAQGRRARKACPRDGTRFYGFDAFYCQAGIAVAPEKGEVEGAMGWFRRERAVGPAGPTTLRSSKPRRRRGGSPQACNGHLPAGTASKENIS